MEKQINMREKKNQRFQFLKHLYDTVEGSSFKDVDMWCIGRELKFDMGRTQDTVDYLIKESLIESRGVGGTIGISHEGISEIEKALSEPDEPTEHFKSYNIINIKNMSNSAIQQGNTSSHQEFMFKVKALKDLVEKLQRFALDVKLDPELREELSAEIDTLRAQSNSPKPKISIISESLKTVRSLVEGVATSAMAPEIIKLIKGLLE
ncbi:hypothetical protein LVD15_25440 [Fulvivirga maritima]|uniref:hypothetical protein n=1 Tax=Fulvivirga maritima TaxID=2904247 RepID=UPI001F2186E6|nr:hypothetical protein [Fulvivirga maritima]UII26600.1 hypothetical protein LVD15_25440 [Fulvivirga maritima]